MLELNGTIIAVILNFLILAWILEHFLYKPVQAVIENRKNTAEAMIGEAEKKLSDARDLKDFYEAQINEAQKKSQEIVSGAMAVAQNMQKEAMEEARKDSEMIIGQAHKEAEKLRSDAYAEAKRSVASLVCIATGKLVMKKLDEASDRALIEEMISTIENTGAN